MGEIIDSLAREVSMQGWIDLPPPPSPAGINQFPDEPAELDLFKTTLPNRMLDFTDITELHHVPLLQSLAHISKLSGYNINIEYKDLVLTVAGRWKKIISGTASQDSTFALAPSVTIGSTITDAVSSGFGVTLGVKHTPIEIGAKLSETVGRSVALSLSQTITHTFAITPKSSNRVSVVHWQRITTYKVNGILKMTLSILFGLYSKSAEARFNRELDVYNNEFIETRYQN